jgi:hypothetical protein
MSQLPPISAMVYVRDQLSHESLSGPSEGLCKLVNDRFTSTVPELGSVSD